MPTKKKPGLKSARKPATVKNIVPIWQKSPQDLIDLFAATMASFPDLEIKKVFGYPCGFVNGNMAAGLHGDSLFVRLNPKDESELLNEKGAAPFAPMPGRAMRGYVVVPKSLREEPTVLKAWIKRALAHTATLPRKIKKH